MIQRYDPRLVMAFGLGMMLLGFALPVLILLQVLPSTLFLNFTSYVASFLGLTTGFSGVLLYVGKQRRDKK